MITQAAAVAFVLTVVAPTHAGMIVSFAGRITSVQAPGSVDAISSYIAVGDTFTGSFEYDPTVSGSSISTINNVGTWLSYDSPVTQFVLAFTSGNSSGKSIDLSSVGSSSMSVADDIVNSSSGPITDLTSGVISHPSVEFQPGLTQRNFVYRFRDFNEAAMTDSAALTDWNASQVFANFDTQSNELAFNSTQTRFAQIARFDFTEFSAAPVATAPEPTSMALFGLGALGLIAGRRRQKSRPSRNASTDN